MIDDEEEERMESEKGTGKERNDNRGVNCEVTRVPVCSYLDVTMFVGFSTRLEGDMWRKQDDVMLRQLLLVVAPHTTHYEL